MSEMSGSDGYFGFSRTVRKSGGNSGFPSPVSMRMYGLEGPTRYVSVPKAARFENTGGHFWEDQPCRVNFPGFLYQNITITRVGELCH